MSSRRFPSCLLVCAVVTLAPLRADEKKSAVDQRIELMRGLTAEYATVKSPLPRSRKPLDFDQSGVWDKAQWDKAGKELGPAARVGDLVQVTGIDIQKDTVVLIINNGMKGKSNWKDHVQVGIGGGTVPITQNGNSSAPSGTSIAVRFKGSLGEVTSSDIKKMLTPVLDFDKHSATENYVDTLPPEIKQAIQEKRPIEGMDRDQVLLALGRPLRKTRESKDGVDFEDWLYGEPPGRVMFVTFSGPKVVKVKETYAGLGGTIAEPPKPPL
jgi:hypothetical protein